MKTRAGLYLVIILALGFLCARHGRADNKDARLVAAPENSIVLPIDKEGKMLVMEGHNMRCVFYVNEDGMAGGAGAASCIPWPSPEASGKMRILETIYTRAD